MRSYRHEARRELIGKIHGPGLGMLFFFKTQVEISGEIMLFWEDLYVAIVEGMVYVELTGPVSAIDSLFDLKPIT